MRSTIVLASLPLGGFAFAAKSSSRSTPTPEPERVSVTTTVLTSTAYVTPSSSGLNLDQIQKHVEAWVPILNDNHIAHLGADAFPGSPTDAKCTRWWNKKRDTCLVTCDNSWSGTNVFEPKEVLVEVDVVQWVSTKVKEAKSTAVTTITADATVTVKSIVPEFSEEKSTPVVASEETGAIVTKTEILGAKASSAATPGEKLVGRLVKDKNVDAYAKPARAGLAKKGEEDVACTTWYQDGRMDKDRLYSCSNGFMEIMTMPTERRPGTHYKSDKGRIWSFKNRMAGQMIGDAEKELEKQKEAQIEAEIEKKAAEKAEKMLLKHLAQKAEDDRKKELEKAEKENNGTTVAPTETGIDAEGNRKQVSRALDTEKAIADLKQIRKDAMDGEWTCEREYEFNRIYHSIVPGSNTSLTGPEGSEPCSLRRAIDPETTQPKNLYIRHARGLFSASSDHKEFHIRDVKPEDVESAGWRESTENVWKDIKERMAAFMKNDHHSIHPTDDRIILSSQTNQKPLRKREELTEFDIPSAPALPDRAQIPSPIEIAINKAKEEARRKKKALETPLHKAEKNQAKDFKASTIQSEVALPGSAHTAAALKKILDAAKKDPSSLTEDRVKMSHMLLKILKQQREYDELKEEIEGSKGTVMRAKKKGDHAEMEAFRKEIGKKFEEEHAAAKSMSESEEEEITEEDFLREFEKGVNAESAPMKVYSGDSGEKVKKAEKRDDTSGKNLLDKRQQGLIPLGFVKDLKNADSALNKKAEARKKAKLKELEKAWKDIGW